MFVLLSGARRWPALPFLALVLLALGGCDPGPSRVDAKPADAAAWGKQLVQMGSCNDCHTPWKMGPAGPEPDQSRFLSGHPQAVGALPVQSVPDGWMMLMSGTSTAFSGPWGVSYAANLTPHDTGLGVWSEELFIRALRTGKHMGSGRPMLPPMPWPNYSALGDEELKAIWAYLQTIPPIENVVPQPTAPASVRPGS